MTVEHFFALFLKELETHPELRTYYKFLENKKSFAFRKAYFVQRLQYIANHIQERDAIIWDCGCGYATTLLFLAMNGFKASGSTLEFYYKEIGKRKVYWKQYGDVSLFEVNYENIFESHPPAQSVDYIIVQDTLHHLEPLDEALIILKNILKPTGKLVIVEENGNNIVNNLRLFKQRGNKRTISIWDEELQKNILLGNENVRSLKTWKKELEKHSFQVISESVEYIRFYYPFHYKSDYIAPIIKKENKLQKKYSSLREYFFFGLNFLSSPEK